MELAPDGKIVVAGTYHPRDYSDSITAFAVQRYLPTGAPDPSFGTGGQTVSDFVELYEEQVTPLALAPDGRPVLVGRGDAVPLAARYTTDGRPDGSFGYNGKAFVEDGTFQASSATVEPDGDVLVAT